MKNIVYISPNFPDDFKYFVKSLKNQGARVLGIGDEAYENLSPELKESLTEYYKVSALQNYDELTSACHYFENRYGHIDSLDSNSEYWLVTEAHLREDFNIDGLKPADMPKIKNKSEMKKVYRSIGLRVAEGAVAHTLDEAKKFLESIEWRFPVIAKPDSGVGASDTFKIHSMEELEEVFQIKPDIPYIFEEFIEGQIVTFDGIADDHSNVILFGCHVDSDGLMNTVNDNLDSYFHSLRDVPVELERIGRACIKAFEVKRRFFHLEFFLTKTGEIVPLEVNIRPPGGGLELFNYAHDIDIFEIWANMIVNGEYHVDYERKYYACHVGRKWCYHYEHSHDQLVSEIPEIVSHGIYPEVFASAMGNEYYIVRTPSKERLYEIIGAIQAKH